MKMFTGDWHWDEKSQKHTVAYVGEERGHWSGGDEFLVTRPVLERIASDQEKMIATDPVGAEGCVYDRIEIAEDGSAVLILAQGGERTEIVCREDGLYEVGFGWLWGAVEWDEVSEVVGAETRKETLPDESVIESLWLPGSDDPWLVREIEDGSVLVGVPSESPTREFLVHLNIQVPAETETSTEEIVAQIEGALAVGTDPDQTPALSVATVEVALAEEI